MDIGLNVYSPLHSNMFLLILVQQSESGETPLFTFQYVSINTHSTVSGVLPEVSFTFQYVSINTKYSAAFSPFNQLSLHSNMFLLIRYRLSRKYWLCIVFTFQYVSINTVYDTLGMTEEEPLHSNMFLLIRRRCCCASCS